MSETTVGVVSERVAEEIRAYMARHRITQTQLAAKVGLRQMYVSRRLTGVTPISVDDLIAFCRALDCSPGELLDAARRPSPLGPRRGVSAPDSRMESNNDTYRSPVRRTDDRRGTGNTHDHVPAARAA